MTAATNLVQELGASRSGHDDGTGFQAQVGSALEAYFDSAGGRAAGYSPHFATMWQHLREAVQGGKWMRPRLVHISYAAYGGRDKSSCATLAAAFELLHAALVVHDDVIDRDFVRRGRDTIGAVYRDFAIGHGHSQLDAEHAGLSAAIVAGDLLLAGSLQLAGTASAGHPQSAGIMESFHGAIFASAAGELDDLVFSLARRSPELAEVLTMERLKTAVYSFEAPLKTGALLAGVLAADADALAAVGRKIGVAYQVTDDLLGTFGQPEFTGKSVESDLREGKWTVLRSYAESAEDAEQFTAALAAFQRGEQDAEAVRRQLRALGAADYAQDLAAHLVDDAMDQAADLGLPLPLFAELTSICEQILTRRS